MLDAEAVPDEAPPDMSPDELLVVDVALSVDDDMGGFLPIPDQDGHA